MNALDKINNSGILTTVLILESYLHRFDIITLELFCPHSILYIPFVKYRCLESDQISTSTENYVHNISKLNPYPPKKNYIQGSKINTPHIERKRKQGISHIFYISNNKSKNKQSKLFELGGIIKFYIRRTSKFQKVYEEIGINKASTAQTQQAAIPALDTRYST